MAEKKKAASKSQDKKEKKKTSTKENKVKNNEKKAVSNKKDTAKVVSGKEEKKVTNKKTLTKTKNKKSDTKKVENNAKKTSKNNKEEIKTKQEALNAIDEELLNDPNIGYIKNQYKNVAIEKINKNEIEKDEKKEVESKSVLDELVGIPKEDEKENEVIEDTGIFSSKAIWYLFFILALIIGCIIYVYNEDTQKYKQENSVIAENPNIKEVKTETNNLPPFSQENATQVIRQYLSLKKGIEYNPSNYLVMTGLTTQEKISTYAKTKDGSFYKTDILFDNLKKHFESIITRTCFEKTFKSHYKDSSGMVNCLTGQGPLNEYEVKTVERIEAPRPTLKVTYTVTPETGDPVDKTNTFEFQVVKGNWIIMNIK